VDFYDEEWLMLGRVMLDDVPPTVPHPLENKMYVDDMHASGARLG